MAGKTLGIIPARGGSKGVPRKNIRLLNGKPLIQYTIEAALKSQQVDRLILTTEDKEIATVAQKAGCEVFSRKRELAEDQTPMVPVVLDLLEGLQEEFEFILLLQPTCPFRTSQDIDGAINLLKQSDAKAVIGVTSMEDKHPARMYRMEGNTLSPLDPQWEVANRQDLPAIYHRNGLIYAIRTEVLKSEQTFFPEKSLAYLIPGERTLNIDTPWDFFCAQALMEHWKNENFEFRS